MFSFSESAPMPIGPPSVAQDVIEYGPAPAEQVYFEVVKVQKRVARPKTAPVVGGNPEFDSPLNLLIQYYDRRDIEHRPEHRHAVQVFEYTDPEWIAWNDLAPWDTLRHDLTRWRDVENDGDGKLLAAQTQACT